VTVWDAGYMATDIEKGRIKERIGFKAKSRLSFSGFLALFADQIRALFCLRNDNHNCRVCDGKRHALVISASVRALNTALDLISTDCTDEVGSGCLLRLEHASRSVTRPVLCLTATFLTWIAATGRRSLGRNY